MLELVFRHLPTKDRQRQIGEALAHAPASDCGPFEGLLGARRDGRLVGVVFSQIEPGKTATVWLPRLTVGEPESTAADLFAATWEHLVRQRVLLAQVLLPTVGKVERATLRLGMVHHLADLLYLVSPEREFPTVPPTMPFVLTPHHSDNHDRLAQVLAATFVGTLDCPGLAGVRRPEDVLAGYRSTGVFDPRRWLIVRHEHRDVGCLLLADHPQHGSMELLYLGLIPAARGRGWGKRLVGRAQWLARLAGRERLFLAVDAANAPAVQTYTAVGFQPWQRRRLYVKRLGGLDSWHGPFQQVIHVGRSVRSENFPALGRPS